jgi:hypothetical protein
LVSVDLFWQLCTQEHSVELGQEENYINQQSTPADARALKQYLEHQSSESTIASLNRRKIPRQEASDESSSGHISRIHALVHNTALPYMYYYAPLSFS